MFDYFLVFESESQWLDVLQEILHFDDATIDVIGMIYKQIDDEFVPIEGYHVNMRTQFQNYLIESAIGEFCIAAPITPYRVWA